MSLIHTPQLFTKGSIEYPPSAISGRISSKVFYHKGAFILWTTRSTLLFKPFTRDLLLDPSHMNVDNFEQKIISLKSTRDDYKLIRTQIIPLLKVK